MSTLLVFVKGLGGLDGEDQIFNSLNRFKFGTKHIFRIHTHQIYLFISIQCFLIIFNCSHLFHLLLLKMAIGLSKDLSSPCVNLEVMVWYGNWLMIKGFLNGFGIMEGKELLSDKSGQFHCCKFSFILELDNVLILWLYSNVVAATDITLLALAGIGLRTGKARLISNCSLHMSLLNVALNVTVCCAYWVL